MESLKVYFDFFFPFAFYLSFLGYILIFRKLSGPTPNGSFCKLHFLSLPFYLLARFLLGKFLFEISFVVLDASIGLLVYFMLHYALAMNFIALASRSVSSTLLVQLAQNSDVVSSQKLFESYGDGKGFDFIKANRIENMEKYGLIKSVGEHNYEATLFGSRFYKLTKFVLGIWGLKQISEDEGKTLSAKMEQGPQ